MCPRITFFEKTWSVPDCFVALAIDLKEVIGDLPDNWETSSIKQLELVENKNNNQNSIETETLLRALAIFLIVANHRDLINYPGGAAYSLLIIAGFNFAAFQVNRFVTTGSIFGVFSLAMRVALPTMAYVLFCSLLASSFDYRSLFLISNLIDPHIRFAFWFINVYVQILLSIMALALLPGARTAFHNSRFWSCLLFSIAAILLYKISYELWPMPHLLRRLPHLLLWLFTLGMAAQFAKRTSEKILAISAFLIGGFLFSGISTFVQFTTFTMPLLIWCPNISVPKSWVRPISSLAGASLFIYLTHAHFAKTVAFIIGADIPLIEVMAALLGGVLTWNLYNKMLSL